jgi:antitoxin PrlF
LDYASRLTSKGQLTVPKPVRDALGLEEGDAVLFRVRGEQALVARTPDLLELAGSIPVPASKRRLPWKEVRRQMRAARYRK